MLKQYKCVGCHEVTVADVPGFTYIKCAVCGSIAAEEIFTGLGATELRELFKEEFGVQVLVALIRKGCRLKIRWFDGPTVKEVRETIGDQIISIQTKYGYDTRHATQKRSLHQYTTDPLEV